MQSNGHQLFPSVEDVHRPKCEATPETQRMTAAGSLSEIRIGFGSCAENISNISRILNVCLSFE